MKNQLLVVQILFLLSTTSFAQDIHYAKEVVKTLASSEFKGRGYVEDGDQIAAQYIAGEFEKIGLTPYKKSFLQKFNISVNTFPSDMSITIDSKKVIPGKDFLIDGGSPGFKGEFETVDLSVSEILNREALLSKLRSSIGKIVVIESFNRKDYSKDELKQIDELVNFLKYHPDNPAAGTILLTTNKLTWAPSPVLNPKPTITIKTDTPTNHIGHLSIKIKNKFHDKYKTQNLLGFIEGSNPDSLVVLTAHYDHLGKMGAETIFPGANDNASGIAMLLNLAKYYKANQPAYNTVFIALAAEELGLLGAKHFVENPLFDLSKIKFLLNFDLAGTGEDGIQVVNGSVYQKKFDRLSSINEENDLLKQIKIRGEACNSDHCMFYLKEVPCFYIYTLGGIQAYHDIYDKSETLPLSEFQDYFTLMTLFLNEL